MTFRFIEVDEIIGAEIKAMDKTLDPKGYDNSIATITKLTNIQSKMHDSELKSKKAEFEREKDLRDFEFKKEESEDRKKREDKEFELRENESIDRRDLAERDFRLRVDESEDRRDLAEREFKFKQEQAEKEFELRMRELDIRHEQIDLERLKSDREFEIKMRELDEKAEDRKFNWYDFMMDILDKFGVAGLMAMILHYEKLEAITTKAWQIVLKCIHLRH